MSNGTESVPVVGNDTEEKDWFATQFCRCLNKAADPTGDKGEWFGRIVGFARTHPDDPAIPLEFKLNGVKHTMAQIIAKVKSGAIKIVFANVTPVTYTQDSTFLWTATFKADISGEVDGTPFSETQIDIVLKAKATFAAFDVEINS